MQIQQDLRTKTDIVSPTTLSDANLNTRLIYVEYTQLLSFCAMRVIYNVCYNRICIRNVYVWIVAFVIRWCNIEIES